MWLKITFLFCLEEEKDNKQEKESTTANGNNILTKVKKQNINNEINHKTVCKRMMSWIQTLYSELMPLEKSWIHLFSLCYG